MFNFDLTELTPWKQSLVIQWRNVNIWAEGLIWIN